MSRPGSLRKIAFVGDYVPRKCGIATFTYDLRNAVASQYPRTECMVVPVDDIPGGYKYPDEVRFQIPEQELDAYRRAADFLNFADVDVVCVQHEFGIYGGPAGSHLFALLRNLRMPIVTTLHTILREPTPDQRRAMHQLVDRSTRLIVMSERGKQFLQEIYNVDESKIDVIPHGIPDMPFVDPNFYKDQFDVQGKNVLLTFGLLSPGKGIEYVLQAMPSILEEFPNTVYIVLGATHPNLVREQGETYRLQLERMTEDLGIKNSVIFYNRFVELEELMEFLGACDIYITPYLNQAQITSGTLAYSFGCGKAVVSTPYWHAEELLADGRGVLVPFRDSEAIAREVKALLRDEARRHAMRKRAYMLGREMIWSNVAHLYMDSFCQARRASVGSDRKPTRIPTLEERHAELPTLRLDHLFRMSDSTGIFQHAKFPIPNFREGYCLDDNARALILTVLLEELGEDTPQVRRLADTYAAFVDYAIDLKSGTWHNFMSFDRRWLDTCGSQDSLGRTLWALGVCVGRSKHKSLQYWAAHLFEPVLQRVLDTTAPRSWAYALLGIHEYLRRLSGDRMADEARRTFTERLLELYRKNASDDWPWFEDIVAYANARIPHALILSGRWMCHGEAFDVGIRTLRWLVEIQRSPKGYFRPVGSNGFYRKGSPKAEYDQQPLEAGAMVSACIEAYRATDDRWWFDEARRAFEWFLGRNDLNQSLYDPNTGGCCDGLQEDRINQNQGAESTLAYLTAWAEMKLLEGSLAAFDRATETALASPEPPAAV
ncbi:glycosyltransferase family 4 protein [Thermostilla marina]